MAPSPPPLFCVEQEEITEGPQGRKAGKASKTNQALPFAQGLVRH